MGGVRWSTAPGNCKKKFKISCCETCCKVYFVKNNWRFLECDFLAILRHKFLTHISDNKCSWVWWWKMFNFHMKFKMANFLFGKISLLKHEINFWWAQWSHQDSWKSKQLFLKGYVCGTMDSTDNAPAHSMQNNKFPIRNEVCANFCKFVSMPSKMLSLCRKIKAACSVEWALAHLCPSA